MVIEDEDLSTDEPGAWKAWHALRSVAKALYVLHWPATRDDGQDVRDELVPVLTDSTRRPRVLRRLLETWHRTQPPGEDPYESQTSVAYRFKDAQELQLELEHYTPPPSLIEQIVYHGS